MTGGKPGHFVERQGLVAQWFDGEDRTRLFTEQDVLDDKANPRSVDVVAPHHGVAVPYDNGAVITIPNPQDASKRPIGARIVEIAREHDVPIEENEVLAGALSNVELGDEIPVELYKAVAEVLIFVLRQSGRLA